MKNIVICCDGTGNQVEERSTNVFKLFLSLDSSSSDQISFYLPGVGTLVEPGMRTPIRRRLSFAFGLAFGLGLRRDTEEAYRFLVEHYEDGDRILLYGFSRGALTARAIAGMIHMFGLLNRGQENLIPYLSQAYADANFDAMKLIRPFTRKRTKIAFLGLWDSVSSYGFAYRRRTLPYTINNRDVLVVRHALALDERRAYFREMRWGGRRFKEQDVKEVWFPGVHADVGGGYDDQRLARIPLQWMLEETKKAGIELRLSPKYVAQAFGVRPGDSFKGDAGAPAHESLRGPWWALELLPKNSTLRNGKLGWPLGRRRQVLPDGQGRILLHQSVLDRRDSGPNYRPSNLVGEYGIEDWSDAAGQTTPPEAPSLRHRLTTAATILAVALALLVGLGVLLGVLLRLLTWIDQGEHWNTVVIFLLPYGTVLGGGWLLNLLSGLSAFRFRLRQPLPYAKMGYDANDLRRLARQLKQDGMSAFRKMLALDFLFPPFYGLALAWTLVCAASVALEGTVGLDTWWIWVLPGITMVADWVENGILLRQCRVLSPDPKATAIASFATRVKLIGYSACVLIPPATWLFVRFVDEVASDWRAMFS